MRNWRIMNCSFYPISTLLHSLSSEQSKKNWLLDLDFLYVGTYVINLWPFSVGILPESYNAYGRQSILLAGHKDSIEGSFCYHAPVVASSSSGMLRVLYMQVCRSDGTNSCRVRVLLGWIMSLGIKSMIFLIKIMEEILWQANCGRTIQWHNGGHILHVK